VSPCVAPGPPGTLPFAYAAITEPFTLQNNGHAIAADLSGRGYGGLTVDDSFFSLQSIVFHARSEHSVGHRRTPLEVHLVHKRYDGDALAITAFRVESPTSPRPEEGQPAGAGDAPPDPLLSFFTEPPALSSTTQVAPTELRPLDFNAWHTGSFYNYDGSLTAPPCSENVQWFVRQQPLKASNDQVSALFHALFAMSHDLGDARAVMPLMGRTIRMVTATRGEPVATENVGVTNQHGALRPFDADHQVEKAKEAVLRNRERLEDLDSRLKAAATAETRAFQNLPPVSYIPPTAFPR
jgi:carbonic anhydrase